MKMSIQNNFKTQEDLDKSIKDFLETESPDMIYEIYDNPIDERFLYISKVYFDAEENVYKYSEIAQCLLSQPNSSVTKYSEFNYGYYCKSNNKMPSESWDITMQLDYCREFGKANLSHRLLFSFIKNIFK